VFHDHVCSCIFMYFPLDLYMFSCESATAGEMFFVRFVYRRSICRDVLCECIVCDYCMSLEFFIECINIYIYIYIYIYIFRLSIRTRIDTRPQRRPPMVTLFPACAGLGQPRQWGKTWKTWNYIYR
jgi:hypothetical protein